MLFRSALAVLERNGWPRNWIGGSFLIATVLVYAVIGLMSRTTDESEYYVAGRRVPAVYNGMATAADWMSAASFIGTAGVLYLQGYGGNLCRLIGIFAAILCSFTYVVAQIYGVGPNPTLALTLQSGLSHNAASVDVT